MPVDRDVAWQSAIAGKPAPTFCSALSLGSALNNPQVILLFRQNTLGNHVVLVPERLFQCVDAHRFATARCVDKAVVAQVDGNMVDLAALQFEEQQVARFQILAVNLQAVAGRHGIGGARQIHGFYIIKRIFHQTAAVEPFTWAAAAPTIRCTEHVNGTAEDIAALFGVDGQLGVDCFTVGLAHLSRAVDGQLYRLGSAGCAVNFRGYCFNAPTFAKCFWLHLRVGRFGLCTYRLNATDYCASDRSL